MKILLTLFVLFSSSSVVAEDKVLHCLVTKYVGLTNSNNEIHDYFSQLENNFFVLSINKNKKTLTFSDKWINQFEYYSIYSKPFKILSIDEIYLDENSSAIDELSDESTISAIDSIWGNTILILDIDEGELRTVAVRFGDTTMLDANCDTI